MEKLTQEEIKKFAKDWYKKLDVHAPMVELLTMIADKELQMVFPEATVKGWSGFEGWYQRVIRIFFDEVHSVKEVISTITNDCATVKVVVQWEASTWAMPDAKSKRIVLDAFQTWEVSLLNGKIVITKYTVDKIEYHKNSAKL